MSTSPSSRSQEVWFLLVTTFLFVLAYIWVLNLIFLESHQLNWIRPTMWSHFTLISSLKALTLEKAMDNPLQYSCLENPMGRGAWRAVVHGVAKSWIRLSNFTFTFHFHALEKETAAHSSVLAWRIPGMAEPGGLPSKGSHRVGHDWRGLAASASSRWESTTWESNWKVSKILIWSEERKLELSVLGASQRDSQQLSLTAFVAWMYNTSKVATAVVELDKRLKIHWCFDEKVSWLVLSRKAYLAPKANFVTYLKLLFSLISGM